jgi:hypothetical protein
MRLTVPELARLEAMFEEGRVRDDGAPAWLASVAGAKSNGLNDGAQVTDVPLEPSSAKWLRARTLDELLNLRRSLLSRTGSDPRAEVC